MVIKLNKLIILLLCLCFSVNAAEVNKSLYRTPNTDNLLYLELNTGLIIIELNPLFAPKHVAQIKKLVRANFYHGLSFYRVIDGFVAQAGTSIDEDDGSENFKISDKSLQLKLEPWLSSIGNKTFTLVQSPDLFASQTGFIEGFGAAQSSGSLQTWLTHCPGVVGMSRNKEPNTATTDFYIVIGQAPRYLDRITTIFGRVILGMDIVQKINRGDKNNNGVFDYANNATVIKSMVIASDLPINKQYRVLIERTDTVAFKKKLHTRLVRPDNFFYRKPPQVLDVCQVPIMTILL